VKHNSTTTKKPVLGKQILLLLILFGTLAAIILGVVRYWQNFDQWQTFGSNGKYYTQAHPDFRLEYPPTWHDEVYQGDFRGTDDIWADFGDFSANLRLYWRPLENPTINEFSLWGQEIIEIYEGNNVSQLQNVLVGVEDYPSFIQTFQGYANRTYIIVYILNDEGGYLLLLHAKRYNEETENTFRQILASFQILETQK
jgi:hypothetical protein